MCLCPAVGSQARLERRVATAYDAAICELTSCLPHRVEAMEADTDLLLMACRLSAPTGAPLCCAAEGPALWTCELIVA